MKTILETLKRKWAEYLLEILVITIGILGAFALNSWNENRKEEKLERQFLERLIDDVSKDIVQITRAIEINNSRKASAEFLIQSVNDHSIIEANSNYFVTSLGNAGNTFRPSISDHTFEEIKSSGRLSAISNIDIRNQLAIYYDQIDNREQYEFIKEDNIIQYRNKRMGILTAEQQISMGSFYNEKEYEFTDVLHVYKRFLSKKDFIDLLPSIVAFQIRDGEVFQGFLYRAQELKALVDSELQSLN
jgi:hypothetical protein